MKIILWDYLPNASKYKKKIKIYIFFLINISYASWPADLRNNSYVGRIRKIKLQILWRGRIVKV